jgi:signal transduction histidine kinase
LGYTRAEIVGSDGAVTVMTAEAAEQARAAIQQLSEEPYELTMRRKDGSTFQGWLRSVNIPHPDGILRVTTIRDISQLKVAEADRIALVEQETRRRALQHFIRAFSHDFKTPLAVINTTSYLLERTLVDEAARARVRTIEEQIERMARMVDNLITLVRLDQQAALELAPLNLVEVLAAVTSAKQGPARKKGLRLDAVLPPDPLMVLGEQERVAQALSELLDNAIRFTEPSGTISLTAYTDDDAAVIEIEDSGAGMPAESLQRIFQPLYRVDDARSLDTGGGGLGLSIVQQVIALHHGHIDVRSEIGRGTVFRVSLPTAVPQA